RVGMMNPQYLLPILDDYISIFKNPKVYKFLHIPVQSGSDEVLKKMSREYSVRDFKEIVKKFREEIPDITISTDIICGFPEEELVEDIEFDVLNISKFAPRANTKAARMKQLSGEVIKERSRRMTELYLKYAEKRNSNWIGWEGDIVIDEVGKDNTMVGRNYAYKEVVLKSKHSLGEKVKVKIKKATPFYLGAELI
ncbi:radical SAM protein, partial [Nanoarchaeota archaeon]